MTATILDGTAIAKQLKKSIQIRIQQHLEQGKQAPGLAVILVGQDPASEIYVRKKQEACQAVGCTSELHPLPTSVTQHELLQLIDSLNQNPKIHGILVQLPLPKHLDTDQILDAIDPRKDVDGFHPYNLGRLVQKRPTLRPCTPFGIMKLIETLPLSVSGLDATVVGASNIVGRPMALELMLAGCTVTVCHSRTKNLIDHVKRADLLVVAVGKPHFIPGDWIKPGAIVFDVGIHRTSEGKLQGDVEFQTACEKASFITPVPGGVGPMTVACLLENTLQAAEQFYAEN